jgi:hypothetical protein
MKVLTRGLDKRLTLRYIIFKHILTTSSNVKVFARSFSGFLTVTCEFTFVSTTTPQFCDFSIPFRGRTLTHTLTDDIFISRMSIILCKWCLIYCLQVFIHTNAKVTHSIWSRRRRNRSHLKITSTLGTEDGGVILDFTSNSKHLKFNMPSAVTGKVCIIQPRV